MRLASTRAEQVAMLSVLVAAIDLLDSLEMDLMG
jgi:hypothetical protein